MNQPAKAHEPSMEEILASIRRIIADDDIPKAPPAPMTPEPLPSRPVMAAPAPEQDFESPPPAMERHFEPMADEPLPGSEESAVILELTEEMRAPAEVSSFRRVETQSDFAFREAVPEIRSRPSLMAEEPATLSDHLEGARQALAEQMEPPLLSNTASAAVDSAFTSLAHTVLSQNARTLDDLVKDMLRPMLKAWLDDNLPGMVERLVRAEIERVSRGH
jgi:cell pole-organizing protein PopZ